MYANLLMFLAAIFIFSMDSVPSSPLLPGWLSLLLFLVSLAAYNWIAQKLFSRKLAMRSIGYFRTERQLSILALAFFSH